MLLTSPKPWDNGAKELIIENKIKKWTVHTVLLFVLLVFKNDKKFSIVILIENSSFQLFFKTMINKISALLIIIVKTVNRAKSLKIKTRY